MGPTYRRASAASIAAHTPLEPGWSRNAAVRTPRRVTSSQHPCWGGPEIAAGRGKSNLIVTTSPGEEGGHARGFAWRTVPAGRHLGRHRNELRVVLRGGAAGRAVPIRRRGRADQLLSARGRRVRLARLPAGHRPRSA